MVHRRFERNEAQTFKVNDFLGSGNYNLRLIKDGEDEKSFSYESLQIKKGDTLKVDCLP